jgi:hypothetical protein
MGLSDPSVWQWVLAAAGLLAFAGLFLQVVMTEPALLVRLAAMLAISVVLTLAAIDSFALMFVYAASAAAVRLSGRDASELKVSDDGRGEPGSNGGREQEGHGLAGLIERAHALGGSVEAARTRMAGSACGSVCPRSSPFTGPPGRSLVWF